MKLLSTLLREKITQDGISEREASRQIGVAPTTVGRALAGEVVDLDTLVLMCKWLHVSPSSVLDAEVGDTSAVAASIASIVETHPKLWEVFEEVIEKINAGKMKPEVLKDIVRYASYRTTTMETEEEGENET